MSLVVIITAVEPHEVDNGEGVYYIGETRGGNILYGAYIISLGFVLFHRHGCRRIPKYDWVIAER